MSRSINFRHNTYSLRFRLFDKVSKVFLCIEKVFVSQIFFIFSACLNIGLKTESCIRPFSSDFCAFKILIEDQVIIQMNLKIIHLVVCHSVYKIFQWLKRCRFTGNIQAKASYFELRIVFCNTFRNLTVIQFHDLKNGTCRPVSSLRLLSLYIYFIVHLHDVTFFTESVFIIFCKDDIACIFSAVCNLKINAVLCFIICCKSFCRCLKRGVFINNLCAFTDLNRSGLCSAIPLCQFRNYNRFRICSSVIIFTWNRNCMFSCAFCCLFTFCYFVNSLYSCLSKRLIDLAVSSDNLFVICEELYSNSFRHILPL